MLISRSCYDDGNIDETMAATKIIATDDKMSHDGRASEDAGFSRDRLPVKIQTEHCSRSG